MKVNIIDFSDTFAEDKDIARAIREDYIFPIYATTSEDIVLCFDGIDSTTQSFVHALISDLLQKFGEPALERLVFEKCSPAVRSLVATVINYSLE
jgi:hypothetical protein